MGYRYRNKSNPRATRLATRQYGWSVPRGLRSRLTDPSRRRSGRAAQPRARRAAVPAPPPPLHPRPGRVLRPLRRQGAGGRRQLRLPRRNVRLVLAGHQRLYLISDSARKVFIFF